MIEYLDLLRKVRQQGSEREDRTGTGTIGLFGECLRINCAHYFPLLTTKRVSFHNVLHELLWFLRGDTNIKYLRDNNVHIWDEWADEYGNLGPVYGHQWRAWGERHDQLANVLDELHHNPNSRRLVVSAWNVDDIPQMRLPPCHCLFQLYVERDGRLSMNVYQRSADLFLGVPYNIASYAILLQAIVETTPGLYGTGYLNFMFGDVHIYKNHFDQVALQLDRAPKRKPVLFIRGKDRAKTLFDLTFEDFRLENYNPHPAIKAPVSV